MHRLKCVASSKKRFDDFYLSTNELVQIWMNWLENDFVFFLSKIIVYDLQFFYFYSISEWSASVLSPATSLAPSLSFWSDWIRLFIRQILVPFRSGRSAVLVVSDALGSRPTWTDISRNTMPSGLPSPKQQPKRGSISPSYSKSRLLFGVF